MEQLQGVLGVAQPPPGLLGVAPKSPSGVAAATPKVNQWSATHGFSFFFCSFFLKNKCGVFVVILIEFQLKYKYSYQTKY
jgi:hypothetical protein